jgi:hypothetical protein
MVSSFDIATKFSGAVDNLLISLKYPFWRPEYDLGVRSSGVPLPTELRRGVGVMDPFPFARYPFGFLKLLLFLGLGLDP